MARSAPHTSEDNIEATAQQPVQDENAPPDRDRSSFSDVAESAPQFPKDDIEAAAQQPAQDENAPADGGKSSHSDELPKLTYEQLLYKYINQPRESRIANAVLNFDNLSRVNVVHLMNELAKYGQAMERNEAAPQDIEHLEDLLHRYSKSVKVAMAIGSFSLIYLHVSYCCSGPRILVQTLRNRGFFQEIRSLLTFGTNIS